MRGYQPKFPVTPCKFPVNNVATLTGIVTACLQSSKLGDFRVLKPYDQIGVF